MIILDFSAVVIADFMGDFKGGEGIVLDEVTMRKLVLMCIRKHFLKHRKRFGDMLVVACDHSESWRRDEFPAYKHKRRTGRKQSKVDWDSFHKYVGMAIDVVREYFPYYVIRAEGAEADDVIGFICNNYGNQPPQTGHEDILIVSADKDFLQLHRYSNVFQYRPVQKDFIGTNTPAADLRRQIMSGDAMDGIPNINNDDAVFVEGRRQKQIRKTFIEEMVALPVDEMFEAFNDTQREHYIRNERLIGLDARPKYVNDNIATELLRPPAPKSRVYDYLLTQHNMLDLAGDFI